MLRPYRHRYLHPYAILRTDGLGDDDDAMHVIGHDHVSIQCHVGKVLWDGLPAVAGNPAESIMSHFAVDDLAQQALAATYTYGQKVKPWRGIIMARQSYRTTVMFRFVVRHLSPRL